MADIVFLFVVKIFLFSLGMGLNGRSLDELAHLDGFADLLMFDLVVEVDGVL